MTASSSSAVGVATRRQSVGWPFAAGWLIGILGGLIGLGGAEFRLPLLMALFGFAALQAVILNKAMSLIVVVTALPARAFAVSWAAVADHWVDRGEPARRVAGRSLRGCGLGHSDRVGV